MPDIDPLAAVMSLIQKDSLMPQQQPETGATVGHAIARALAPHLADPKFWGSQGPQDYTPNAEGKIPDTESDPRMSGALSDVGRLAPALMPLGAPLRAAGALERGGAALAEGLAPKAAGGLRSPAATGAALLGSASDAEAAPRLSVEDQRKLNAQKALNKAAADRAAQEHQSRLDEIEAKRREGASVLETEMARKKAEEDFEREKKSHEANLPFREKYPNFTKALPAIGAAGAFSIPYALRAGGRMATNSATKMWENAVRGAETAPSPQIINELKAFQKGVGIPKEQGLGIGPTLGGALAPFEASMVPDANDIMFLKPDDPNREIAKQRLLDPARAAAALAEGVPAAWMGSKAPLLFPERLPPSAKSQALIDTAKLEKTAATRAANAKAKKKSP